MIPSREIKEKARERRIPTSTIERDYTQNWLLKHLSLMNIVLKGGTGIRKVYIENYRFSDDLDFTLLEKIEKDTLRNLLNKAIIETKEESGITLNEEVQIEKNINGFEVSIFFRILRSAGTPIKIKLDLTRIERDNILLPIEKREIIHPYSDDCNALIKVYSLEEIMSEKIRALFERTRPRDLYDVWNLYDRINLNKVLNILPKKCMVKGVKIYISSLNERKDDFANAWENSLQNQLKELPDFNYVYNKVIKILRENIIL